jgi:colanic acid/amylovoran biosynthesis glycosyltransferase
MNALSRPPVAHVMPEYLSRTATYVYNTLKLQQDYAPVVLTEALAHLDEYPLDAPIVKVPSTSASFVEHARAFLARYPSPYQHGIAQQVGKRGCVLIHGHHGWSGRVAVRAAVRHGIPLVTTYYGRDLSMKKRRREIRQPYHLLFRKGSRFICEGPAMGEHLVRLGCPRSRIRLVKIGIELEKFPFEPRRRVRPLIVMQAARFMEKKGFDLTIRAYAEAQPRLGESELWLIGDGELRPELESLVDDLGIRSSVRFLGSVAYDEYQELIRRAHICVQPSRVASDGDTEGGAPTVLLEMQATGVPIVGTRHADIPFVVHDGRFLVPEEDVGGLAEALEALAGITDDEYRRRTEEARAYVEREHDVRTMAASVEAVYADALGLPVKELVRGLEKSNA